MPAPQSIIDLITRFESQLTAYKSGRYNETELRRDFLDPFFEALGWDIRNLNNATEKYRDVIHESSVEIGGQAKSADYLFQIGGSPIYFVEAKKPSVNIETDPAPAFQLKSYAWSAKLPFSILTDFEQLAFYECLSKPLYDASPSLGRIGLYHFRDYAAKWDEIAALISRSAVTTGAFETYLKGVKGKRGTTDVDDDFLAEMERWRNLLAHNIALRNPAVTQRELNFAVQTTIDRLIFLRICEDRGIEPEEDLKNATDGIEVYGDLLELFRRADSKYNSGLFHFTAEKNRSGHADSFTPNLKIDDKVFKDILANLYLPKSPYRFNYFSADILGQVYERFLGKVILHTPGSIRANVEDKPEVRKAGGVYYTPTYIVDYIVKNTVGELLKDKTPDSFKTIPLRVLDPACGSGSFLLGAYQYLMDWYLEWFISHEPSKHAKGAHPAVIETLAGWQLTLEKKKDILTRHIYGVDIDSQAVEVTKLSLLLKVVENPGQLSFVEERILPDLADNIKCGNSLIGPDFYDEQQGTLFGDEEQYRVNAFDWHTSFHQVFKDGGFDTVIGNPPYIGFQGFDENKDYLRSHYRSATGRFDIYVPFIERGIEILRNNGLLGFICPTNFTKRGYGNEIRQFIRNKTQIQIMVDFEDVQIFNGALNYTGIFIFQKSDRQEKSNFIYLSRQLSDIGVFINQNVLSDKPWVFRSDGSSEIIDHIVKNTELLKDLSEEISEGIVTGKNDVFLLEHEKLTQLGLEEALLKPCIRGRQIRKYQLDFITESVIYPYELLSGSTKVISSSQLEKEYPKIWDYLKSQKKNLSGRGYFEKSTKQWYELWCQRNIKSQKSIKIIVPELAESNRFALENHGFYFGDTVCGIVIRNSIKIDVKYLLGILNSKLMNYYYQKTTVPKANQFFFINQCS